MAVAAAAPVSAATAKAPLTHAERLAVARLDMPRVANAMGTVDARPRNVGFMRPEFRSFCPNFRSLAAYAVSCKIQVGLGKPVQVGGLTIKPGDLAHADKHGVHTVPLEVAKEIPETAARIFEREQRTIDYCRSPDFSLEGHKNLVSG